MTARDEHLSRSVTLTARLPVFTRKLAELAAESRGLSLSRWTADAILQAAAAELGRSGESAPV